MHYTIVRVEKSKYFECVISRNGATIVLTSVDVGMQKNRNFIVYLHLAKITRPGVGVLLTNITYSD